MEYNVAPTGNQITERLSELVDAATVRVRSQEEPRTYLGASLLGYACDRRLGYEFFKTAAHEGFKGNTYRLFDTGHDAEERVKKYLEYAGFTIKSERSRGGQFGFGLWPDDAHPKGRVSGHTDGIITEAPINMAVPAIWENKAMNNSRWEGVSRQGLKLAEPEYYVQVQLYMGLIREGKQADDAIPNPSLWTAFNRNTGRIYYELVDFDQYAFEKAYTRGHMIVHARGPEYLNRISKDPADFKCKFCPYRKPCWEAPAMPAAPAFGAPAPAGPANPAQAGWVFGRQ